MARPPREHEREEEGGKTPDTIEETGRRQSKTATPLYVDIVSETNIAIQDVYIYLFTCARMYVCRYYVHSYPAMHTQIRSMTLIMIILKRQHS